MDHKQLSDLELLAQLKESDAEAFNTLFHRNWSRLYAIAKAKTENEQAAFDMVQDIFVQLWIQRHTLDIRDSLQQYLSGAVRYQIFNYYRSLRREKAQLKQLGEMLTEEEDSKEEKDERIRRERDLEEAVDNLPTRMKDVYLLRIRDEYSFRDIAETLDIKPQTAKNTFSRALVLLRQSIKVVNNFFI